MTDSLGANCTYGVTNLNQYWTDGTNAIGSGAQHEISSYQNLAYKYINDTHLSQVSGTDLFNQQSTYQMSYDALGRCAVRVMNGVTTSYIYDGEKPILEYKTWSAPTAKNLYGKGIDEILMRTDASVNSGQPFYHQDDHEGSVTHLTDSSGAVLERYTYDAFGKPTIFSALNSQLSTSAYGNRFMFTGREYVEKFGIYEWSEWGHRDIDGQACEGSRRAERERTSQYRNRAYHPGLGRFMSEDPKGFDAGDNNFFRYCGNDPIDRVDPMGLTDQLRQTPNPMVRQDYMSASGIESMWQMNEQSTIAGEAMYKATHVEPAKAESGSRAGGWDAVKRGENLSMGPIDQVANSPTPSATQTPAAAPVSKAEITDVDGNIGLTRGSKPEIQATNGTKFNPNKDYTVRAIGESRCSVIFPDGHMEYVTAMRSIYGPTDKGRGPMHAITTSAYWDDWRFTPTPRPTIPPYIQRPIDPYNPYKP